MGLRYNPPRTFNDCQYLDIDLSILRSQIGYFAHDGFHGCYTTRTWVEGIHESFCYRTPVDHLRFKPADLDNQELCWGCIIHVAKKVAFGKSVYVGTEWQIH
jgi:hypothetical protein